MARKKYSRKNMWALQIISFLVCLTALVQASGGGGKPYAKAEPCKATAKQCEYWWTIHEQLAMHLYPFGAVSATKGKLHFTDPRSRNMTIPPGSIIVADGFSRIVTAVNGQTPGPPIIVTEGQEVIVHVKNDLTIETVTIHWHGMHMINNTWNDGANLIGQCPIAPGQSFTYRFKADPSGTHWYHSHVHGQRVDGLYGAIIVKPKGKPMLNAKDVIMQVTDWWHMGATETHLRLNNMDFFTTPGFKMSHLPNGVLLQALDYYSVLIEGLGRWMDDPRQGTPLETPRKIYTIKHGQHLRFRIINTGNVLPFRISVDQHPLLLVASDGIDIKPIVVESVIVSPGERYDVIIRSRRGPGNYWVRAASLHNPKLEGLAILRYSGAPAVEPRTKRSSCKRRCLVVNCIFNYFPKNRNLKCIPIDRLRNAHRVPVVGLGHEKEIEEHWYNFGVTLTHAWGYNMWVNGKIHKNHYSDLLHKNNLAAHRAGSCGKDRKDCWKEPGKPCPCFNMVTLKGNKYIQMVIASVGTDPHPLNHPIHLHGYSFQVLKIGYPPQDPKTGMKKGINPDIECVDKSCFNLRWSNPKKFTPEYFSKLNPNPIKKDTVYIPAGGYAVVRFFTDNPGRWLMHCHIDFDGKDGMAMAFKVAPELIGPQPPGAPRCTTFFNDPIHHPEKTCKK